MLENITTRFHTILLLAICFLWSDAVSGQNVLSGYVLDKQKQHPIPGATITIAETDLWAIADKEGRFRIENVPIGKIVVQVTSLNYVKLSSEIIMREVVDTVFFMIKDDLALENVVVTATIQSDEANGTTYSIDRKALDQLQMLSVQDAMSLLPGGKTNRDLTLTSGPQNLYVNGRFSESGNPAFGVGVEVDGVRLSPNALPGITAVDVRNISTTNIESIEVITGVPSVEYGDVANGMVRIHTRKGVTPLTLDMSSKPNTKQIGLSRGFSIGKKGGVLNASWEYTKSVSNIASPYTSYDRNSLTLNYSNTFNKARKPLLLNVGFSGGFGGMSTEADPDKFVNTYSKSKDNVLRTHISGKWLLNKKWITNLEATVGVNYNNKLSETSQNKSASSSQVSIRTKEEGYHVGQTYDQNPNADILLIPPGYWYEISYDDNKALNYSAVLKANWAKRVKNITNNLMIGGEYRGSKNFGKGNYYADMRYAPTWREYRYDEEPAINNYAFYAEDRIKIKTGTHAYLQWVVGMRSDFTSVKGSEYGTVSSLSPRTNLRYTFWERQPKTVSDLSIRAGWGRSVKLPSFNVLYKVPGYRDILTFAPGTTSEGETFYAYYTVPYTRLFNPDLKWQYTVQSELAVEMKIAGVALTIVASQGRTKNTFESVGIYTPFTYKFTDQSDLENSSIPIANRIYAVDKYTGIVTVKDRTGTLPSETLTYREFTRFYSNPMPFNNRYPVDRKSISFIADFKQIKSLRTSLRLDGAYYTYKHIDETLRMYMPNTTQNMADGNPYKYIGIFVGGASSANGEKKRQADLNVTTITHIPSIRMVLTARLEGSLHNYSQNLSEYGNIGRGFVLDSRDAYMPSQTLTDIYGRDRFVGVYPLYYISLDDMNTPIPFAEKFLWAKDNDPTLYNELAKMVIKTNTNYYFNPNRTSFYYSANISITKEIGELASISFNAINFLNNMSRVRSTWSDTKLSLFESSYIPRFYYGISLRLKFN